MLIDVDVVDSSVDGELEVGWYDVVVSENQNHDKICVLCSYPKYLRINILVYESY